MPAERTLTERELNRTLLDRQFLLERSSLPLVRTVEQIGGLQTQYAPSGYVGLWSRLNHLRRADLTRALEARTVIQGTLLRSTIHMVSPGDYWRFLAGIRGSRREWFLRITRRQHGELDMAGAAAVVRKQLSRGPRRMVELRAALSAAGFPSISWAGLSAWVDMVRVPPSGTWEQRRADLYGLASTWIRPARHSERDGLTHIVRRYLGAFGPASVPDIADWAGVPNATLAAVVEGMRLNRYRDQRGRQLVDLPGASIPDPAKPAPVRFLPTWDATLLVHCRRTQILREEHRPRVFNTKTPHSVPTFLVDGTVAGTWRWEDGTIKVQPFERLRASVRNEVDAEAARLAAFHKD